MTIIYAGHGAFDDVKAQLQGALPAAGWKVIGNSGTAPVPASTQSWSAVYGRDKKVAQVSLLNTQGVTSTIFIIQDSG